MLKNATQLTSYQNKERINSIFQILAKTYPKARIALNYSNPWELTVAVILSAQCTDIMVNRITAKLFKKYRSIADYAKAEANVFEKDIRQAGFFRNKARNIIRTALIIQNDYQGKIPDSMDSMLSLPGIARKSANIILGNTYGVIEGIAVDTHVSRISQRLRIIDITKIGGKKPVLYKNNSLPVIDYIKDPNTDKIENQLMVIVPRGEWARFSYRIIDHGRKTCDARMPRCGKCQFNGLCPVSRQG